MASLHPQFAAAKAPGVCGLGRYSAGCGRGTLKLVPMRCAASQPEVCYLVSFHFEMESLLEFIIFLSLGFFHWDMCIEIVEVAMKLSGIIGGRWLCTCSRVWRLKNAGHGGSWVGYIGPLMQWLQFALVPVPKRMHISHLFADNFLGFFFEVQCYRSDSLQFIDVRNERYMVLIPCPFFPFVKILVYS